MIYSSESSSTSFFRYLNFLLLHTLTSKSLAPYSFEAVRKCEFDLLLIMLPIGLQKC